MIDDLTDDVISNTLQAAAWLFPVAEKSVHEDAEAAARWLEAMGIASSSELIRRGVIPPAVWH